MAVPTTGSVALEGSCQYIQSSFRIVKRRKASRLISLSSPALDPPYPVYGGIFREEAIILLRRFYIQENEKGKLDIQPPMTKSFASNQ